MSWIECLKVLRKCCETGDPSDCGNCTCPYPSGSQQVRSLSNVIFNHEMNFKNPDYHLLMLNFLYVEKMYLEALKYSDFIKESFPDPDYRIRTSLDINRINCYERLNDRKSLDRTLKTTDQIFRLRKDALSIGVKESASGRNVFGHAVFDKLKTNNASIDSDEVDRVLSNTDVLEIVADAVSKRLNG